MTAKTTMPPKIKAFFDEALPSGQGGHVLALAEIHKEKSHLQWLCQHMPELVTEHNLGVVGLERSPYINVFLWAYRDGLLQAEMGEEAAKAYLKEIFCSNSGYWAENAPEEGELALSCMHHGVRVVACDSRDMFEEDIKGSADSISALDAAIEFSATQHQLSIQEIRNQMRTDSKMFADVVARASNVLQQKLSPQEIKARAQHYETSIKKTKISELPDEIKEAWVLEEVQALCRQRPAYYERLARQEKIIQEGRTKTKPIGSDALSATLLYAANIPNKNSLTIHGFFHIDGLGEPDADMSEYVHGTVPDHLVAQSEGKLRIRSAAIGDTDTIEDIYQEYTQEWDRKGPIVVSRNPTIDLIDLAKGDIGSMPKLDNVSTRRKMLKGFPDEFPARAKTKALLEMRENPLLVKGIKRAFDAVYADWNPDLKVEKIPAVKSFEDLKYALKQRSGLGAQR